MKQTYEELERERNELAAQVNKLRETIELIAKWNSHTTELAVNHGSSGVRDFYRRIAESSLSEQPPSALAALKAQWQADAIEQSVKLCRRKVFDGPDLYSDAVLHYASELRQRALESGNENV